MPITVGRTAKIYVNLVKEETIVRVKNPRNSGEITEQQELNAQNYMRLHACVVSNIEQAI